MNRYNIIIEGTFRTANTPLKTLNDLKEHNYKTFVYIKTCPDEVSWSRCLSRYEIGLNEKEGKERFTDRSHHDLVVKHYLKMLIQYLNQVLLTEWLSLELQEKLSLTHKTVAREICLLVLLSESLILRTVAPDRTVNL